MDEFQAITEALIPLIKSQVNLSETIFNIWFGDLKMTSLSESAATLTTPTNLRKNILDSRYIDLITDTLASVIGFRVAVTIVSLEAEDTELAPPVFEDELPELTEEEKIDDLVKIHETIHSNIFPPNVHKNILNEYTFENFVEGSSNKFAKAACMAVANNPADAYNPLFIWGHSGLGKTHLLCATINQMRKTRPNLKIRYKTSEVFINELIRSIQNKTTDQFKEKYRTCDVLMIDDIQFIAGKESTQEEFFHTFSTLYESGRQIILTSDRPPQDIRPLEERLRTRFEGGLIADIQPPTFELRQAIIRKKASDIGIELTDKDIEYIASRLRNNVRQIEGVLKKIEAYGSFMGASVNKALFDKIIEMVDPGNIPPDVMNERILHVTSAFFGVSVDEMKSKKKTANVAEARHYAIYIFRRMTELTLKEIGDIFGRDHSTVMASISLMETNLKTKKDVEQNLAKIVKEIRGK